MLRARPRTSDTQQGRRQTDRLIAAQAGRLERTLFRIGGIDQNKNGNWKTFWLLKEGAKPSVRKAPWNAPKGLAGRFYRSMRWTHLDDTLPQRKVVREIVGGTNNVEDELEKEG